MMLIVFATPRENPFPLSLNKGQVATHEEMLLLLAGIGERSAERLEQALAQQHKVTHVVEYGGAAVVYGAEIGACYTVIRTFDRSGVVRTTQPAIPGIAPAAAICDGVLYRGESFSWGHAVNLPLLYTMETVFLASVCRRHQIPFYSLRRATDDGHDRVRSRYEQVLADSRPETAEMILLLRDAFSR